MRSDSPGPEWYEPRDELEDDEPEPIEPKPFVITGGLVIWRHLDTYD